MRHEIDTGFKQHAASKSQPILLKRHNGPMSTGRQKDGEKDLVAFLVHYCESDIFSTSDEKNACQRREKHGVKANKKLSRGAKGGNKGGTKDV